MDSSGNAMRIFEKLGTSNWAFAVVCSAAEIGMLTALGKPSTPVQLSKSCGISPDLVLSMLDVLDSLGIVLREGNNFGIKPSLASIVSPPADKALLAELRSKQLQSRKLVESAMRKEIYAGWNFTDPLILQSQGFASGVLGQQAMAQTMMSLPGLIERLLSPTASFLDVGAGVGAMSIEPCRIFPNLHVVAIEPLESALVEARRNIAEAGFTDRIELRNLYVQDLTDDKVFDMAFFPQMFMPDNVVRMGLRNIWRALRPGGWISVAVMSIEGMDLESTVSRFVDTLWGGNSRVPSQVEKMLVEAGYAAVKTFPMQSPTMHAVIGQRPA
jgi:predicted O-methyltransferase YrrM